jgi:hypothetical protein
MVSKDLVDLLRHYDEREGCCSMDCFKDVSANNVVSWSWLAPKWQGSYPREREQIEALMVDILPSLLPQVTSCYELLTMWLTTTTCSTAHRMIERRIVQLIATTTNWFELDALLAWIGQYASPFVEHIETQMKGLIFGVTSEECPWWFSWLLINPHACFVPDVLKNKVQELKAELKLE